MKSLTVQQLDTSFPTCNANKTISLLKHELINDRKVLPLCYTSDANSLIEEILQLVLIQNFVKRMDCIKNKVINKSERTQKQQLGNCSKGYLQEDEFMMWSEEEALAWISPPLCFY